MKEPKNYYKIFWKVTVGTIVLFLVAGIAYKLGMMSASCKIMTLFQAETSFFSNSWSVYTTIFGIVGVILGVVFPIYNSTEQSKEFKEKIKELDQKISAVTDVKTKNEVIQQEILDNQILLELEKINQKDVKKEIDDIFKEIRYYELRNSPVVYNKIVDILNNVNSSFVESMTESVAKQINSIIILFYPTRKATLKEQESLGKRSADVAYDLVYDAFIKARQLSRIQVFGLLTLKYIYKQEVINNVSGLKSYVLNKYTDIENRLNKEDMKGVENIEYMKELVKIFKDDLNTTNKVMPKLPEKLYKLINGE